MFINEAEFAAGRPRETCGHAPRVLGTWLEHDYVGTRRVLAESHLETAGYLTMGAEDMAYMQEKVPGCYFFIGSNNKARHLDYGHHHPKFDFDEDALVRGSALMAAAALDMLK